MRLIDFVMRLIPASVGGSRRNVWNAVFAWLEIIPKFRPPFSKWLLNYPRGLYCDVIERNRAPLWNWVEKHKPDKILEIGLGSGVNARKMIDLAGNCKYYCFDDLYREESIEAYEDMRDEDNVSFFIGDTKKTLPECIKDLPKMDLIFIDGGHDYETVKNDWEHCKRLMHEETACFFHDYDGFGVSRVVNSISEDFRISIKTLQGFPIFALVRRK